MNLAEEIKKRIAGDVFSDPVSLDKYSRDASLFEVRPALVVVPKDTEDIRKLVGFAAENDDVSLTVRSGATDMTGGPLTESIVLDFMRYFNRVINVENGHAITQPGVFYRDFERETLKHHLLLPSYPASREICTVGGMVANNSGGEKTLTYGQTKEYVAGLRAVLSDGNEYEIKPLDRAGLEAKIAQNDFEGDVYRRMWEMIEKNNDFLTAHKPYVSKNSAGYFLWDIWDGTTFDLTKLFTGSQGTLGIITEINFKLIKPKTHSQLLIIFLHDLKRLGEIAKTVMKFGPESFESYDDKTLKLALRFLPDFIKLLGKGFLTLVWQFLPEFWMFVTGGVPKLILMAEFTGDSEAEVKEKLYRAQAAIQRYGMANRITKNEEEVKKYWTIRRESFNLFRKHLRGRRTAPFIDDMIVRPEHLSKFLPRLEKILKPYHLVYSVVGHVGDGNFHVIPLMKIGDPRMTQIIPELSKKVYDLILEFHGSITGEHNDGLIRTPFLKQMYGEKMYGLFEETKQIFDPKNIFNPGKKVGLPGQGGSFEYAMAHLQK